ncbi:glycoside hydrolase family 10 protein, partial [Nodosilinea nodulosa]
ARGMTLHAWVWVFAAGNQRHNRLLNQPADYLGPVLSRHPDWAAYDNSGSPIPRGQDKPFLDPANPEVRSYLTRLMTEIVTDYDVDGLQLDYIRYPFQDPGANRTYGYGEVARWRFQSISGVDPMTLSPRPSGELDRNQQIQQQVLWDRWTGFRVQQVTSFVETISSTLRRHRPDLILSAAVFPIGEHDRLQRIQQDWGAWARAGYLDWIVLMSYAGDTSRFEQIVSPWLVDESFGSTLLIPAIRLLNLSNAATLDQMQASRDLPTPGYALFAANDFNTELSAVLGQTQSREEPGPTTPYAMALSRYQALQREWSWLLANDRLWMDRDTLTPWIGAVNDLGREFETLAQEPSRRHLETVEVGLARVRAPLKQGILIDTANSSYRLQSWQYRLTAIEQLLTYGERTEP